MRQNAPLLKGKTPTILGTMSHTFMHIFSVFQYVQRNNFLVTAKAKKNALALHTYDRFRTIYLYNIL